MPTKLLGRSVLLIMTQYRDKMGTNRVGIGQVLALSASDRARVEALRGGREPGPAPKAQPRSEGRMGPPAQQFTSSGQQVRPAPEPVGVADGSPDLPW
jgi:hypothetical protein